MWSRLSKVWSGDINKSRLFAYLLIQEHLSPVSCTGCRGWGFGTGGCRGGLCHKRLGAGTAAHTEALIPGKWQEISSWWQVEIKFPSVLLCFCTSPLLFFIKLPLLQAKSFSSRFLPLPCLDVQWESSPLQPSWGHPTTNSTPGIPG